MDRKRLLLITIILEGGLFVLGAILAYLGIPILGQIEMGWEALLLGVALTLPMLIIFLALSFDQLPFVRQLNRDVQRIVSVLFANTKMSDLVQISILAGLGEEVFFRGFLQQFLSMQIGPVGALLIASAIFGLLHAISAAYAIYATLIGLYLGLVLIKTENLLVVIIIHTLYDFIALYILTRKSGLDKGQAKMATDLPDHSNQGDWPVDRDRPATSSDPPKGKNPVSDKE